MTDPHLLAALHQVAQVLVIAGADSEANIVERAIERIKGATENVQVAIGHMKALKEQVAAQRDALHRIAFPWANTTHADSCRVAQAALALTDAAGEEGQG